MPTFSALQSSLASFVSRLFSNGPALKQRYKLILINTVFLAVAALIAIAAVSGQPFSFIPNGTFFANPGGASETYSTTGGGIDLTGPFFQNLGTNGRACGSCHQPSDGVCLSCECPAAVLANPRSGPDLPHGRWFQL